MSEFTSVEDASRRLELTGYLPSTQIATAAFLADRLQKPVLVEGPAGVGKTELAKALATALGRQFVRLQCYEGLDEAKALYEWEYAKQLLYTQLLKDKIGELLEGASSLTEAAERVAQSDSVFFSRRFLLPRPVLQALLADAPALLLVDEIDKADPEFEAFLLEVLADNAVTVPELGTLKAKHIPRVVLTSNAARELSDALKRRCLHLHIDYPSYERELAIVRARVPQARPEARRAGGAGGATAAQAGAEEVALDRRDASTGRRRWRCSTPGRSTRSCWRRRSTWRSSTSPTSRRRTPRPRSCSRRRSYWLVSARAVPALARLQR